MIKDILIPYIINEQDASVNISYQVKTVDNIHTITCKVHTNSAYAHHWLQIRKFELRSMVIDGGYMQLFSDNDHIDSINATLFMEETYRLIMIQESCDVAMT